MEDSPLLRASVSLLRLHPDIALSTLNTTQYLVNWKKKKKNAEHVPKYSSFNALNVKKKDELASCSLVCIFLLWDKILEICSDLVFLLLLLLALAVFPRQKHPSLCK